MIWFHFTGIYLKEMDSLPQRDICPTMFVSALWNNAEVVQTA